MQKYYRFLHSDKEVVKKSSSGGAFTLISDIILDEGGIVYGAIIDENLKTRHIRATNKTARDKMRSSKYVQSDIKNQFENIKKDLDFGRKVLFSGTPCQNFAVLKYLKASNTNTKNLILLEVICHGVGSNRFFNDYIKHLEDIYKGKAITVNFRAKYRKGQKQDMAVFFNNGKTYHASSTKYDWYYSIYLKNLILRRCCYVCPFANKKRYSDISIADHWGYRDEESYSLIISNSIKGQTLLNTIKEEDIPEIKEVEIKQSHMLHPSPKPKDRDTFWDTYIKEGYLAVQKQYGNNTIKGKTTDAIAKVAYGLHLAKILKHIRKR